MTAPIDPRRLDDDDLAALPPGIDPELVESLLALGEEMPEGMPPEAGFDEMMPTEMPLEGGGVGVAVIEVEPVESAEEAAERRRHALAAVYGDDFPLARDDGGVGADNADWVSWAKGRWAQYESGPSDAIFLATRNRLFRSGVQWVSASKGSNTWREPPMPKDAVRAVDNHIGPALDWALQIMSEQRPGFRFSATNPDPDRQRKAQAQQLAVEYQWHRQDMRGVLTEAGYHAQTDGSSFLLTYWDPDAGPWEELVPGSGKRPTGDVATKVYTVEQVRVSPEATATKMPMVWVFRDVLPVSQAVHWYGPDVAEVSAAQAEASGYGSLGYSAHASASTFSASSLLDNQPTVDRLQVFCERSEALPEGLNVVVVGETLAFGPAGLLTGRIPVARLTDGSVDPAFFCEARMNEWIAPQMRVNMILSKWIENVRQNAGGKLVSKTGAIVGETLVGGMTTVLEVRGSAPIDDTLRPIQGFSLGTDAKELLQLETKKLEDRTGWNDSARGQFSADQSGRAITAIREQLERAFAPFVYAASKAMCDWAECQVAWMRWGYQMPRMIGVVGKNRPDLAKEFSSVDFDEVVDVYVDPETLMPMPRTLRLYLLDQDLQRGVIDVRTYRQLRPMGYAPDTSTPYDVQEAKAKRVAEAIRMGQQPEPIVWQDDEAIHQDVLEHDLILAADIPPEVQQVAQQRWSALANQSAQKMGNAPPDAAPAVAPGGMPGEIVGGAPPLEGGPEAAVQLPPSVAPTFGSSSSIGTAPPQAFIPPPATGPMLPTQ